jgi:hypothetical protein
VGTKLRPGFEGAIAGGHALGGFFDVLARQYGGVVEVTESQARGYRDARGLRRCVRIKHLRLADSRGLELDEVRVWQSDAGALRYEVCLRGWARSLILLWLGAALLGAEVLFAVADLLPMPIAAAFGALLLAWCLPWPICAIRGQGAPDGRARMGVERLLAEALRRAEEAEAACAAERPGPASVEPAVGARRREAPLRASASPELAAVIQTARDLFPEACSAADADEEVQRALAAARRK